MRIDPRLGFALIPLVLGASFHVSSSEPARAHSADGLEHWNHFGCNVSDSLIRGTADAMVSSGMPAPAISTS